MFSEADLPPILRRFKVVTSAELPPPGDDGANLPAVVQAEAGGEDDGTLPQELLQEVRNV